MRVGNREGRPFAWAVEDSLTASPGNVASFRMHVSRTSFKVGLSATQRARTSLGFDERNRLSFAHCLTAVFSVRTRQGRRELEPDDFPVHNSCRMHDIRVRKVGNGYNLRRSRLGLRSEHTAIVEPTFDDIFGSRLLWFTR